jgi:hypothetical protein
MEKGKNLAKINEIILVWRDDRPSDPVGDDSEVKLKKEQ